MSTVKPRYKDTLGAEKKIKDITGLSFKIDMWWASPKNIPAGVEDFRILPGFLVVYPYPLVCRKKPQLQ